MFFFVHGLINLIESKVGKVLVYVYGFTDFVKKNYVFAGCGCVSGTCIVVL
jgi:hypothetical protein